ncbi:DegT/DnrJ/EryC1/StrS family aminotransferase [Marinobacterium aestuariivivens]|uniref:DegT/DnrJ/EryC1/StrS family aminotransferase n=1 Tax=Marinobacterium aestuariivivens TaxID=1698799 RepID=A0ABW1ZUF3_9GAMM
MIPFLDLKAQYRSIKDEIDQAVLNTLASSQYVLGSEVSTFEEEFAEYCGAAYGIAVNSGTSALHLALLAAEVGPGDEVITVSNTFVATVAAIDYCGAAPVFVDVEPDTLNMNPHLVEEAITERTRAILPVHLHGHPADLDPILEIARRHDLRVIEDACQAHGAEYKDRRVGGIGDLGCFSFYPGKNLGACGEGGMVVTQNEDFARKIRMLRDWGQEKKYHHKLKGYNYRMDGIQGAILRVKLRHLDGWTTARREVARRYNEQLVGLNLTLPIEKPWAKAVYHVYAVRILARDALHNYLNEQGVQTGIHYPIPVHLQTAYASLDFPENSFPISESSSRYLLSLPLYPELSQSKVSDICNYIHNFHQEADEE